MGKRRFPQTCFHLVIPYLGLTVDKVSRRLDISEQIHCCGQRECDCVMMDQVKRLKDLVADLFSDNTIPQDATRRNF